MSQQQERWLRTMESAYERYDATIAGAQVAYSLASVVNPVPTMRDAEHWNRVVDASDLFKTLQRLATEALTAELAVAAKERDAGPVWNGDDIGGLESVEVDWSKPLLSK